MTVLNKKSAEEDQCFSMQTKLVNYFYLTLDLPTLPLFNEQKELGSLPTIPLYSLFKKFNGQAYSEESLLLEKTSGNAITTKKKYEIKSLPNYLFLKIERFGENNFFKEKNFTIVNFPLTGLDLTEFLPTGSKSAKFDLIGNVIHMGTA